jgi:transcription antitermination factor NusG
MILTYGDVSQFGDMRWYMIELRSEKTIESTLRRLGQSLAKYFREIPVEIFIPIEKRDLHTMELTTGNYIFARSPVLRCLLQLRNISGIVGLVTQGDTRHPANAIQVDHPYVASLIDTAETLFINRAHAIGIGSFVRIIDGEMRDWCGTITELHDGVAAVRVEIKTKTLIIETPVRNLLDKSFVPEHLRVFYYSELVEALERQGLAHLVQEDIYYVPEDAQQDDGLEAPPPTRHGRQQTVTALVKKLIVTGTLDPVVIGRAVLEALKEGELKAPKNLSIIHGIIKNRMIEDHFRTIDPSIDNYRDVVERFGAEYKFSIADLVAVDPGTGIPVSSDVETTPQQDAEVLEAV